MKLREFRFRKKAIIIISRFSKFVFYVNISFRKYLRVNKKIVGSRLWTKFRQNYLKNILHKIKYQKEESSTSSLHDAILREIKI